MNREHLFIILFLCFFLFLPATPGDCQEKPKCAVLMLHADEASSDIYEYESKTLTTRFTEELTKFQKYEVMDTGDMIKTLSSQSEGGEIKTCKLKGCAVRSGAALNVDYVIYGVFGHVGSIYSIETNLVEVKTGNLIQQVTTDYEGDRRGFAEKVPLENLKSLLGVSQLPEAVEIASAKGEPTAADESKASAPAKKFHFGPRIGIGASDDGVEFGGGLECRFANLSFSILGNDAGFLGGFAYYLHAEGNSPYLSLIGVYYDTENHGLDEIGRIWGILAGYRIMLGHGLDLNAGIGAGYVNWDQTESNDFGDRENDEEIIPIGELTLGYMF
jgi:TolB-like protein